MSSSSPSSGTSATQFAARIRARDLDKLQSLRTVAGIEVMRTDDPSSGLWLRGGGEIRSVPHLELTTLQADGTLVPVGKRVPTGRLSTEAIWVPLSEVIGILPPCSLSPGSFATDPVPIHLLRSEVWSPPTLLQSTIKALLDWVENTPQAELETYQFAMNRSGNVLVRSVPPMQLPPLQVSSFFVLESHHNMWVARPCGWDWVPRVHPSVIIRLCALAAGETALFATDGSWSKLPPRAWTNLSRSAVRISFRDWQRTAAGQDRWRAEESHDL